MNHQGKKGVAILSMTIREALPEMVSFKQRPDGNEESLRIPDRGAFRTKEYQVQSLRGMNVSRGFEELRGQCGWNRGRSMR